MSKDKAPETPSWLVGTGLETDMTGDPRSGAGSNIRFWMPAGSGRKIIFLTEGDAAPVLWEHQFRIGQGKRKWQNWISCIQPLGVKCPLCQWAQVYNEFSRYKGVFFTVIDCQEFTDKGGNKRQNEVRLLCAKSDTAEKLQRKYMSRVEGGQGLRFAQFEVYRTKTQKSASVGEEFEFVKMIAEEKMPSIEELNYADLLQPDVERMSAVVEQLRVDRGMESETSGEALKDKVEGTDTAVDYGKS